jgi:hypothetical protein
MDGRVGKVWREVKATEVARAARAGDNVLDYTKLTVKLQNKCKELLSRAGLDDAVAAALEIFELDPEKNRDIAGFGDFYSTGGFGEPFNTEDMRRYGAKKIILPYSELEVSLDEKNMTELFGELGEKTRSTRSWRGRGT